VLSSFFAGLALLLACIGLFGLMSYTAARRTREIGIRLALGEKQVGILWEMLRGAVVPTLAGLATGIVGALGLSQFLSSILFGVVPTDPITFLAVSLLLAAVAFVAFYIPARRATKINPMAALRFE
jgi:ABC-type antimicrobial peptide transport system permease subunit